MVKKRPAPEEVLRWMAENHVGCRKAAAHFGVPHSTVKRWAQREPIMSPARAHDEPHADPVGTEKKTATKGSASPSDRPSRAKPKLDLAEMSHDARELLRQAVDLRLRHLAEPESLKDPKGQQAIAQGLGILVDRCPDILRLVGGDEDTGGGDDDADRIGSALGLPARGAPALALVGTGKG